MTVKIRRGAITPRDKQLGSAYERRIAALEAVVVILSECDCELEAPGFCADDPSIASPCLPCRARAALNQPAKEPKPSGSSAG